MKCSRQGGVGAWCGEQGALSRIHPSLSPTISACLCLSHTVPLWEALAQARARLLSPHTLSLELPLQQALRSLSPQAVYPLLPPTHPYRTPTARPHPSVAESPAEPDEHRPTGESPLITVAFTSRASLSPKFSPAGHQELLWWSLWTVSLRPLHPLAPGCSARNRRAGGSSRENPWRG